MCEEIIGVGMNFIFTCLETSHKGLYDWLKYLDGIGEVKKLELKQWNKNSREVYSYQYVNDIPLRDSQPAIKVNWCKLIHTRESDGAILYENAFITRHELNEHSVPVATHNTKYSGPQ
jgi:hypothetical protein